MAKGTRSSGETVRRSDPATGVTVWQVTQHPSIHHHLYFLTPSMTPEGDRIIFASYRCGRPELYGAGFPDGEIVQLTDAEGVNPFSGTLDRAGAALYFTRRDEVRRLDLATLAERVLARYPGARLGECSLNAGETLIVTAGRGERGSFLAVTATDGSGGRIVHESARTLIHPQFHPTDPALIEYASDPAPRMWTIRADGTANTCLWEHGNDEFLVHETFLGQGDDLIVVRWPYALQRFETAARAMRPIAAFTAWHISSSRDGRVVLCDTAHPDTGLQLVSVATGRRRTLCHPGSSNAGTQWTRDRYALAEAWQARPALAADRAEQLSWMEMALDTVYGPQWTHPHPSFAARETRVVYTSDASGTPHVYVAEIPAGFRDPLE